MPFRALGLLSTLCTAFDALVGMLLRGGKTVEKREFLPDFKFYLRVFCTIRMFLTFTYLFSFVDADLMMCMWTLPGFGLKQTLRYAIFANVLKNRCMDAIRY